MRRRPQALAAVAFVAAATAWTVCGWCEGRGGDDPDARWSYLGCTWPT